MREAIEVAREAARAGEVPVGAIVVRRGGGGGGGGGDGIIVRAGNRMVRDADATAHAELLAVREAARVLGEWRLEGCTLYVTMEPCAMCAGAIVLSRVSRVVFGAWDDKAGMAGSVADLLRHPRLNHRPEVRGGVLGAECGTLLRDFFGERRGTGIQALD